MNRQFPEEKIKMSNKYMEKFLTSLLVREMQNEATTTEGTNPLLVKMETERASHTYCWWVCVGKLLKAFNEIVMIMSGNSKNTQILLLSTLTLGNQSFGNKSINAQRYMYKMLTSALFVLSKN